MTAWKLIMLEKDHVKIDSVGNDHLKIDNIGEGP